MAPQTKADRQAAAKKAAATRKRNRDRADNSKRGTKAAATAQSNRASAHVDEAKHSANSAVGGLVSAAKSLGGAVVQTGRSVATRSKADKRG